MQLLCQSQTEWDESVPQHIHTAWFNLKNRLPTLNEIKFPRKVIIKEAMRIKIHGFCDASEKAYGGCIYSRSIDKNLHQTRLKFFFGLTQMSSNWLGIDFEMNRNKSDWFGMNFNPKVLPGW